MPRSSSRDGNRRRATESVAERIKRLRLARRLTQQELAVEIGAAVQSISRWEHDVLPTRIFRRALADALGVTVEALMTGILNTPSERRRPSLQPLREAVSRVSTLGEDVLADFVNRVVQVAQQDYLRPRRR
jgi:transcriptional regulator with XRE-family HTH domain